MNLELLANELLLDIFEYFPAVQLLRAFHGLNIHFDNLIFTHFRKHRLDFRTASKQDFDIVCRENLPFITDRIISLGLSDDDETPQQIYLFRSYGWKFNQFKNLRSLSLDNIRLGEMISDILPECSQLIHLNLTACHFQCTKDDILRFVNNIWSLPKLIYCYLTLSLKYGLSIPTPTNISLSMEHLSIVGVSYQVNQLIHLCEYTPHLRYLAFDLSSIRGGGEELQTSISSITELNLSFASPEHNIIESVLQHMPNLCQLKVETCYFDMNGYEWEQIIRNYLPKLQIFQLKMRFQVISEKNKKELFNSFRTPFWLEEHQWFVRYHYNPDDKSNMICLYTLPYNFSQLDILFPVQIKSTCSNENDYWSYEHVQHLLHRSSTEDIITSNLHFPNITYLSVTLPINNHLLSLIQKFDRLTSMEVSRPKNMSDGDAQLQLQTLLDHALHLYSLKFKSWPEAQLLNQNYSMAKKLTPIILKTRLIRRVNLRGYDCWFNDEECAQIPYSSLGKNCEVLFIKVQNRMNILYLINSMANLRALIIQSRDDNWTNYSSLTDDRYVQWLQENLPSTCSIKRDLRFGHYIRIWIHL